MSEQLLLDIPTPAPPAIASESVADPSGYRGLYAFHKYWGKKPHETLAFIIQHLTNPNDIVLDPFVGSGTAARESLLHSRRFIGCDVNPIAVRISRLLCSPPAYDVIAQGYKEIVDKCRDSIMATYRLEDGSQSATHYLCQQGNMVKVWCVNGGRSRVELEPTQHDLHLADEYSAYTSRHIRSPKFFTNARINSTAAMTLDDLFTGRARHNIDILLDAILALPPDLAKVFTLCLTAASGQMSRMVFAVTNRGKTRGGNGEKVEVGSWVIGYWRPELHFEVNVWNCFKRRAEKLLAAIKHQDPLHGTSIAESVREVVDGTGTAFLGCLDCRDVLAEIPSGSVDLVITDPPHSDRIPYLELSAMWNAIAEADSDFQREIVVSNARERGKSSDVYTADMQSVLAEIARVLKPSGALTFLFNARNANDWLSLKRYFDGDKAAPMSYVGCFPSIYSAGSVVQDNRDGGLKHDYALVFVPTSGAALVQCRMQALEAIPGWTTEPPTHTQL